MGETDRARREIEDAREHLTEYADELSRRLSPEHLKAEARAQLTARVDDVKGQLKARALDVQDRFKVEAEVARDRLLHDRNTQYATGAAAMVGIATLARRLVRSRREASTEATVTSFAYRPGYGGNDIERYTYARTDAMGPPPPLFRPGVITEQQQQFVERPGRRFGLGSVLLGGLGFLGLRALSKRPEAVDLRERALDKVRSLGDSAQDRTVELREKARSLTGSAADRTVALRERAVEKAHVLSGAASEKLHQVADTARARLHRASGSSPEDERRLERLLAQDEKRERDILVDVPPSVLDRYPGR